MGKELTDWNLFLCVALLDLTLTDSCPSGWFGPDCSLMCHCSNNSTCDLTTGECSPGVYCGKGFFGPGCQFADILAEMGSLRNPKFLVDGIKTTCNPNPRAFSLTVFLNHSSKIYWFRIHTDVDKSNCCMSVPLDKQTCQDFRMYRVSEKILDVTCNSSGLVTQLVIKGPVVGHMCDLEISGGRNVALKEYTIQLGIFSEYTTETSLPVNAVDGNRNPEFEAGHCSHTGYTKKTPFWYLVLKNNEQIFRIVIYNRNKLRFRLDGFTLELYNTFHGQTIFQETSKVNGSAIYFFNLPSTLPTVKKIVIRKKPDENFDDNYLTLCEVELYKQHVCDQNHFGLYCNQTCSCEANRQCHPATGVCGTPCVTGKNDLKCDYKCPPNCLDNKCRDGECVSCKKGFKGTYCEEEHIPHIIFLADICAAGKYGTNCTLNCPKNCKDSKCNKTTGHCLVCVGKELLPLCDKEPDDDVDDQFHYFYQLLLLLLLIPLCLCCFCCCIRPRNKPVQEEKAHKQATTEQGSTSNYLGGTKDNGSSVDSDK